ncbi:uncharacterized protein LOC142320197 isoform X2 [Lycorma delicatula]
MACQVEVTNGIELNDKESAGDSESDIEIMTLKHSLKEKLNNETLNVNVNGGVEGASSSSGSINNGTLENGHTDDKPSTDSEHEVDSDSRRQTPKKSVKGKQVKGKKEKKVTPGKTKRQTPVKKLETLVEEETTRSEQSEQFWNSSELPSKDIEDDNSTIDVVGDNDESGVLGENEYLIEDEDEDDKAEPPTEKHEEDNVTSKMFSRLRNSMRFSISPRKQEATSSSGSVSSSVMIKEPNLYSFHGITGRRALHQTNLLFSLREAEPAAAHNLKRKAQSESPDVPQRKHFITTLSERSPGWKFFSSPFNHFWSLKKASVDSTVSSSTPVRKLHEDIEDSMSVNVDESMDFSLQEEEFDLDKIKERSEIKEEKLMTKENKMTQSGWRCSIM